MFLVINNTTAEGRVRTGCQFAITHWFALFLFIGVPDRPISGSGSIPTKCTTLSQSECFTDETPAQTQ